MFNYFKAKSYLKELDKLNKKIVIVLYYSKDKLKIAGINESGLSFLGLNHFTLESLSIDDLFLDKNQLTRSEEKLTLNTKRGEDTKEATLTKFSWGLVVTIESNDSSLLTDLPDKLSKLTKWLADLHLLAKALVSSLTAILIFSYSQFTFFQPRLSREKQVSIYSVFEHKYKLSNEDGRLLSLTYWEYKEGCSLKHFDTIYSPKLSIENLSLLKTSFLVEDVDKDILNKHLSGNISETNIKDLSKDNMLLLIMSRLGSKQFITVPVFKSYDVKSGCPIGYIGANYSEELKGNDLLNAKRHLENLANTLTLINESNS